MSINKENLNRSAAVLLLFSVFLPASARAQTCCSDSRFELLKIQSMGTEFRQRQLEHRASRERERRNVPVYNARLNAAVITFHKHITQDNHYLVANCGLCRKHLGFIRSYSKKLDQAMK